MGKNKVKKCSTSEMHEHFRVRLDGKEFDDVEFKYSGSIVSASGRRKVGLLIS